MLFVGFNTRCKMESKVHQGLKTQKTKQSESHNGHISNGKVPEDSAGSLTDQDLQQIKKELGLIDTDGFDNPGSASLNGDYVSSSESDDGSEPTTPFDSPLTETERRLLDQFTFQTYCPSPTTSRSASLAEVADSLISDLEKYDFGHPDDEEFESDSDSDQDKRDSDLGSSVSVTSGVEGLERLVEQLVQRKESQDMADKLPSDNNQNHSHPSTVDDDESDNTDSLPASIDSGIPTLATTTPHRYFVVVAIDFGTTFSGYAFAFTRDPAGAIHMMRRWEGGDPGVTNQKTPTTLLLRPDGSFHSFGFGARDFYHDLEPDEARKWLFFEKFKMALHSKKVICYCYL